MKVRTKLIVGFLIIVMFIWVTAFIGVNIFITIHEDFELRAEDVVNTRIQVSEMEEATLEINHWSMEYILYGNEISKERTLSKLEHLEEMGLEHAEYMKRMGQMEEEAHVTSRELLVKIDMLNSAIVEIFALKSQGLSTDELLRRDREIVHPVSSALLEQLEEHETCHAEELKGLEEAQHEVMSSSAQLLLLVAGLITLIALAIALVTARSIIKPLHALHRGTEIIGQGNLDFRVGTKAKDEIGQLSRAFDQMADDLQRTTTSIDNLNVEITERKRVEAELRHSREFFQTVFNSTSDAISIINVDDFTIAGANDVFLQTYGLKEEEVIGKNCYEVTHQRSAPCAPPDDICPLNEIITTGEHTVVEHIHYGRNGEKSYVEVSAFPIEDEKGQTIQIVHVAKDITERKQAEEEIRKFKTISDNAGYGASIASIEGDILYVNEAYARMYGYTIDEILGKHYATLYTEESAQALERFRHKLLQKGTFFAEELWRKRKNGTVFPSLTTAGVVKDDQGNPLYVAATAIDITERKQAEEEIKSTRDYLQKLNNSLEEVIFNVSYPDRTIEYVNRAVETVFGYTPEECIGRNTEFLHKSKKDYDELAKRFGSAVEDNKSTFTLEFQARKKDGKVIDVGTNFTLVKEHGELTRVISVFRDITERKQAEDALRESEERFSQLYNESPVGYHESDSEGRIIQVNQTELDMLGYTAEEMLGRHVWDFRVEKDTSRQAFATKMAGTMPPGRAFERTYRRKDGTTFPALLEGRYVKDESGQIIGLRTTIQDITGPKKAEQEREKLIQELQETLAEVKTLSGLLPICAWCKKLRDDEGYWKSVEDYLGERTKAEFTHGMCPDCLDKYFAGVDVKDIKKDDGKKVN